MYAVAVDRVEASKFLSYVLRHRPDSVGVTLDAEGWIEVEVLLGALSDHGRPLTRTELEEIVATSDKQRFALDGDRIRANQGHSVQVDLALEPRTPPEVLYHGTVERFLASIRERGLLKGQRTHVHLSADRETATRVAQRRGKPVILEIECGRMREHVFYLSDNGVWLVEAVPPEFIR